jgi:hypothetical protein
MVSVVNRVIASYLSILFLKQIWEDIRETTNKAWVFGDEKFKAKVE